MKIVLINPSYSGVYEKNVSPFYPPLGLMYLSAYLQKNGHETEIIDYDMDVSTQDEFVEIVKHSNARIFGVTSTTAAINNALQLVNIIKINKPGSIIVLGGPHPTVCFEEVLQMEAIDYVVRGEGELALFKLVQFLENKTPIENVPNLVYKINGNIHENDLNYVRDINELPFPDRKSIKNFSSYTPPAAKSNRVASIVTSRGCTSSCKFCSTKSIFGRGIRMRNTKNIIDELLELEKNFGVTEFHIMDDCFTASKKRTLQFCAEILMLGKNYKFAFANGIRADQVDEEILLNLKKIGVQTVMFGVETGDETILHDLNKKLSFQQIGDAFKIAQKLGFETWGFFIVGLPGDSRSTIKKTIDKAIELNPTYAKFLIFKPTPGTEYFKELYERKLIFDFDYSHYGHNTPPVHRLPDMSSEEIENARNLAYRRFYMRFSKIFELIRSIDSISEVLIKIKYLKFLVVRTID